MNLRTYFRNLFRERPDPMHVLGKELKVKGWSYVRPKILRTNWVGETLERLRERAGR